ncbi:uncharacterized protein BT62DRAFT_1002105 [Guyanagaster necrorhizus]|uniref:Threonine/serine exporter-like N-terminal domain-containing protein n=1 Tax=Guyanagaster necrorhizus TaxID=856835 RepID=A0A9P8AVX7_9AGAR|nr:uncharacterized protein BT62DRAFT_1002105 [Guyanagaster necrorhizus MCA 3950]KAG7449795.1 hypothetical protein BT62DRAFT_1002105 [Guyanagaster necrorhizus MCA 3950]
MLFSFIAAGMAASGKLCYSVIASGSVVLILPGFIVSCGSLELMPRNLVSGAVRMFYAVIYSLFLGFGQSVGAEAYEKITSHSVVGVTDYTCALTHDPEGGWWQRAVLEKLYALESEGNGMHVFPDDSAPLILALVQFLGVAIASVGWVTNHFTSTKFVNQNDISAAVGAFAVGFMANLYGCFFSGNAFVIMPVFFSKSRLAFEWWSLDLRLISVAIGLTVGTHSIRLGLSPIPVA